MKRKCFLIVLFAGWMVFVPAQKMERVLEPHPIPGYGSGVIYGMAFDQSGAMWIAFNSSDIGGFKYVEPNNWTAFEPIEHHHGEEEDTIEETRNEIGATDNSCVAIDYRGNIWFGSAHHGISRLSDTTWRHITIISGLADNTIQQILPIKDTVWIATKKGLSRFVYSSNSIDTTYLIGKNVTCLAVDLSGKLWVGTSEGAYEFDGTSWSFPHRPIGGTLTNSWFDVLTVDAKGNIWAAIYNYGIYMYDGNAWSVQYSDKDNKFGCLTFDKKGHLWAGRFNGGGVWEFYDDTRIYYTNKYDNIHNDNVQSIAVDKNGAVWLGSSGGLTKIYDRPKVSVSDIDGEGNENITVYPNPAQNHCTISNVCGAMIHLYCISGQKIGTYHSPNEDITLDISPLAPGIYMLKIEKDNKFRSFKISVVR